MPTPTDLLAAELRRDGARPLLTFYDDATGERVELSVATTANWVAKTANLLVDDLDVAPGDTLAVVGPLHWQPAVVMLAGWACGAVVAHEVDGDAVAAVVDPEHRDDAVAALGTEQVAVMAFDPMGAAFARLVGSQPDAFGPAAPGGADLVAAGAGRVPTGARVLTTVSLADPTGLAVGLLAPLASSGSVVLVRHADPAGQADRCAIERVTHTLGVSVAGLPRLDAEPG